VKTLQSKGVIASTEKRQHSGWNAPRKCVQVFVTQSTIIAAEGLLR
jgi:hypothetical protein